MSSLQVAAPLRVLVLLLGHFKLPRVLNTWPLALHNLAPPNTERNYKAY